MEQTVQLTHAQAVYLKDILEILTRGIGIVDSESYGSYGKAELTLILNKLKTPRL